MCHMLKCMMTSKIEIQAHTLVWSVSFLVLVMFTLCGHLVVSSDMVAEQVRIKVQKIRKTIRSVTETTASSSRERERKRFKWNLNLQEGADINMFAHDHRVHSFYKVPGETHNLKVLTFVETTTSMSGAVIVPDLSAIRLPSKRSRSLLLSMGSQNQFYNVMVIQDYSLFKNK